jgi:acetate kinase
MRKLVCEDLDAIRITIDLQKNEQRSNKVQEIQQDDAQVKVLVIPTNEELEIAKQTYALLS